MFARRQIVSSRPPGNHRAGFTLIEMAVALVIVALLLGSLLVPLQNQVEQRKTSETQRTLDLALEALIGFAAANSRLPCPADPNGNSGVEVPAGGGNCTFAYNGLFPAATLGLSPTDAQGYLVDAWGLQQNRIHYAVTATSPACANNAYTTTGGMKACWSQIAGGTVAPNLVVCSSLNGNNCAAGATLTNSAPAVIFSLGKNAPTGGVGTDEAENLSNNRVFVWHTQSGSSAPNGEFDDIMVWLSPSILYSRMISAGQLP